MHSEVIKNSFNFTKLLHYWSIINHFVIVKIRKKEFLTCSIFFHVPCLQLLPKFLGRTYRMVEIEQRVVHRIQNVSPACEIISIPLLPPSDLLHSFIFGLSGS